MQHKPETTSTDRKEYFILPVDQYGQPTGQIMIVSLTEEEYKEAKTYCCFIFDNYTSAVLRAMD